MQSSFSSRLIAATSALALAGFATSALAQNAKPRGKAGKPPAAVTVTNARTVELTGLVIQTAEDNPRVVANMTKALPAGKAVKLALKKPKGCAYNVLGQFADGSETEAEGLNLCKDGKIRLTE